MAHKLLALALVIIIGGCTVTPPTVPEPVFLDGPPTPEPNPTAQP